jgi:hypothetical protein
MDPALSFQSGLSGEQVVADELKFLDRSRTRAYVNGVAYALNVSPRLAPADIVEAINRKSAAKISESEIWSARVGKRNSLPAVAGG